MVNQRDRWNCDYCSRQAYESETSTRFGTPDFVFLIFRMMNFSQNVASAHARDTLLLRKFAIVCRRIHSLILMILTWLEYIVFTGKRLDKPYLLDSKKNNLTVKFLERFVTLYSNSSTVFTKLFISFTDNRKLQNEWRHIIPSCLLKLLYYIWHIVCTLWQLSFFLSLNITHRVLFMK